MSDEQLADVQAGDKVYIFRKGGARLTVNVSRVTKTQVIIGDERFKKERYRSSAYKIGEKYSKYGVSPRTYISVWSEEIEKGNLIHDIVYSESKLRDLPFETLRQIWRLIEGEGK